MNDGIKIEDLRNRVMGCCLGKAIGGTLGMPLEGSDGPHDVTFYSPIPTEMLPNDDLDLQVLWACVLDRMETPRVDRDVFADAWRNNVDFPWDEYGVAKRNINMGLKPPQTSWRRGCSHVPMDLRGTVISRTVPD